MLVALAVGLSADLGAARSTRQVRIQRNECLSSSVFSVHVVRSERFLLVTAHLDDSVLHHASLTARAARHYRA